MYGMPTITPEEREALRELVDARRAGRRTEQFIRSRIDPRFTSEEGNDAPLRCYIGLHRKGLLDASPPSEKSPVGYWRFGDLTSNGYQYFDVEREGEKREAGVRDEERRYARRQAWKAFFAGAALTLLVNHRTVAEFFLWIADALAGS